MKNNNISNKIGRKYGLNTASQNCTILHVTLVTQSISDMISIHWNERFDVPFIWISKVSNWNPKADANEVHRKNRKMQPWFGWDIHWVFRSASSFATEVLDLILLSLLFLTLFNIAKESVWFRFIFLSGNLVVHLRSYIYKNVEIQLESDVQIDKDFYLPKLRF